MNNKLSKIKDASEQTNMFVRMINIVNNHYDIIFDHSLHCNNNMFLDKYHGNLDSRITSMSKEREKDLFRKYKLINEEIKKKQRNINCKTMILEMNIIKFLIYSGLYKGMRRKLRKCKDSNESERVMYRTISIINEQYNKLLDETLLSTNNNYNEIS